MIRTQLWEPDAFPGVRFITQWNDAEPQAAHVCLEASVDGVVSADPQGDYERVLQAYQAAAS